MAAGLTRSSRISPVSTPSRVTAAPVAGAAFRRMMAGAAFRRVMFAVAAIVAGVAGGCSPQIGDECTTSADCDIRGARVCQRTMPGGYCTVQGCEEGTCPENSVCVMFRPEPIRLSSTWCMGNCSSNSDCRDDYRCLLAEQLGENIAMSLEDPRQRFCAVPGDL